MVNAFREIRIAAESILMNMIAALLWSEIVSVYALFEMQSYLTDVWGLSLIHAAAILNFWNGLSLILPLFFLYLVDAFLGNFKLLVFTSLAHTVGIVMVAVSTPPLANATATCKRYESECIGRTQQSLLYAGLAFIAVGFAGNRVSVRPFLVEQIANSDRSVPVPKRLALPSMIAVIVASVVGAIAIQYIRPQVLKFGIPAIYSVITTFAFLTGSSTYEKAHPPYNSPLFNVFRVLLASSLKTAQTYPDDYHRRDGERFSTTRCLRGLHKAAIILPGDDTQRSKSWTLCTVAEVEEAKIAVRMVPMWMTFVVCEIVASVGDTYFVEQAANLNRNIGKLRLPIQVLLLARKGAKGGVDLLVKRFLKTNTRDSAPPFGIGAGMICSILCCISAALVERKRLSVVRSHGLLEHPDEQIKMSVYWMLFQFVLLGGLESLLTRSVNAYYKSQSPESMQAYLDSFNQGVAGLGYMCSVLFVYVVGRISERGGNTNTNWFQYTLNRSRLDRYYWMLAALSTANLVVFAAVASCYSYKKPEEEEDEGPDEGGCLGGCLQGCLDFKIL